MLPKLWHALAIILAGLGALSIGLTQFASFDLLGLVPSGVFNTVVIGAVGFSGGYLLWLKFKKQI